jgi:hypothetical protein
MFSVTPTHVFKVKIWQRKVGGNTRDDSSSTANEKIVKAVDEIQDFVSKIYKNFEAKIT